VERLLELTGNIPLAISLIATVAATEGCGMTFSRWNSESTRMLSDRYDQRSSLHISIMLSFTSPRMTPEAQDLLSILSIIPDGLTDSDLLQAKLPITDIFASQSTLLRTSLAFVDKDHRIKVLMPIREYTRSTHPPRDALKHQLQHHFHGLLGLWNQFKNIAAEHIVPQITHNLGNINSVLEDALRANNSDIIHTFQSILFLNNFYRRMQSTSSRLLPALGTKIVD
jgi:hypothetical protein